MKIKTKIKNKMLPTCHFSIERWKYNIEYNVWVSTHGRLKDENGKIIKPKIASNGYMVYNSAYIHRLVMSTWKPVKNYGRLTVDHLNHNKRENTLWNLEWVTTAENQRRAKEDQSCNEEDENNNEGIVSNSVLSSEEAKKLNIKIDGVEKTIANLEDVFNSMPTMKDITKRGYLSKAIEIAMQNKNTSFNIGNHVISNH